MIDMECPWCEATLPVTLEQQREQEQNSCPECLTSWTYVPAGEPDLAAAA